MEFRVSSNLSLMLGVLQHFHVCHLIQSAVSVGLLTQVGGAIRISSLQVHTGTAARVHSLGAELYVSVS